MDQTTSNQYEEFTSWAAQGLNPNPCWGLVWGWSSALYWVLPCSQNTVPPWSEAVRKGWRIMNNFPKLDCLPSRDNPASYSETPKLVVGKLNNKGPVSQSSHYSLRKKSRKKEKKRGKKKTRTKIKPWKVQEWLNENQENQNHTEEHNMIKG